MSACSSEETSSTTSAQSQHEPPHEKRARQDCSELEPQRKRKCVGKVTYCCVPLSAASEAGQSGVEASNEAVAAARPPAASPRRKHRPRDEERREDRNYRGDNLQREREEMWLNLYESRPQNNTSEMATWLMTAMAVSDPKNIDQLHVLRGVDGIEQFVTRTSNMSGSDKSSDRSGSEQNDDTD